MKKELIILLIGLLAGISHAQEVASANVLVKDFKDNPIGGAEIEFISTQLNKTIDGVSGKDGRFIVELPAGEYNIRLKSMGKTKDYSVIEIPKLEGRQVYNDVNIVIQYAEEVSFTLEDLHFETALAIIKPESYSELDELVKYLELKPDFKIEIGGHTDAEGSDQSNLELSQRRAEAVRSYLIKKGVKGSRMIAKGYGEQKPIADNDTAAGRALNRRTEINVLELD